MATPPSLVNVVAGQAILYSDVADLQTAANKLFGIVVAADVSTSTSGSATAITGLSFAAVSGACYSINLLLWYTVGGTNTGLTIGWTGPGADLGRLLVTTYGQASATGSVTDWITAEGDLAQGTTATDSTARRMIRVNGDFRPDADGTYQLTFSRRGTSTTVTILEGSGGTVLMTA